MVIYCNSTPVAVVGDSFGDVVSMDAGKYPDWRVCGAAQAHGQVGSACRKLNILLKLKPAILHQFFPTLQFLAQHSRRLFRAIRGLRLAAIGL